MQSRKCTPPLLPPTAGYFIKVKPADSPHGWNHHVLGPPAIQIGDRYTSLYATYVKAKVAAMTMQNAYASVGVEVTFIICEVDTL